MRGELLFRLNEPIDVCTKYSSVDWFGLIDNLPFLKVATRSTSSRVKEEASCSSDTVHSIC